MHPGIATARAGERFSAHKSGARAPGSPPRQFSRSSGRAIGSRGARRTCSTLHAVGGGSHATHPHRAPAFPPVIAIARVESVDPSVTVCRYDDLHGLHGAGATAGAEESTAARVEEAVAAGTARAVRPQLLRRVDLGRGLHRTTVGSSVSDVRARRARMGRACARHGMLRARRQHVHRRHCRAHAGAVCV